MATIDLYIDTFAKRLVTSLTDTTPVRFPSLVQEDTPTLRIWLLQPVSGSTIEAPYIYIPTDGVTIQMALGLRVGNATTYYTQQFSWTASTDATNPYFEALLPMNTDAITNTLLGSAGTATAYLEIKMISGGYATTILSEQCTVLAAVIKSGGLSVPPLATPMTVEAGLSTFVLVNRATVAIWECETDPTVRVRQYLAADGTMHYDPIA